MTVKVLSKNKRLPQSHIWYATNFFKIHTLNKMVVKVEEQWVIFKFSSYIFLHFINEHILLLKSHRKHTNYIQFPIQVHDTLVETHETGDAQISNTSTCYKQRRISSQWAKNKQKKTNFTHFSIFVIDELQFGFTLTLSSNPLFYFALNHGLWKDKKASKAFSWSLPASWNLSLISILSFKIH